MIGAYFTHGPQAGKLAFSSFARLPKAGAKPGTQSGAARVARHGLQEGDLGAFDSDVLLTFIWELAGKPSDAAADWRREIPLEVWLDNYSVHKSERVKAELPRLEAAQVRLRYLPAYCPELSGIEPIWQEVKYRQVRIRSYKKVGDLKLAVEQALAFKAAELQEAVRLEKAAKLPVGTA